jgi:carbonic anhydrase
MESRFAEGLKELQTQLNVCKRALVNGGDNVSYTSLKSDFSKVSIFMGKREAIDVDNFLWEIEQYFEAVDITDEKILDY